jgi:flagellin FlaB
MFNSKSVNRLHNDQSGASALETAIILIAFVVVASVFAFTILSAGSASTEQSEESIYAGLSNVQSSMTTKGAIIATANAGGTALDSVVFTLSLASGGDPVNIVDTSGDNVIVIDYRDELQAGSNLDWTADEVVGDGDLLLEPDEQFQITVDLTTGGTAVAGTWAAPAENIEFTLQVKPPTGAVLNINATTPAVLEAVMELR